MWWLKPPIRVVVFSSLCVYMASLAAVPAHALEDGAACARGYLNSVALIVDDMRLPHEGRPHGVPDNFDWSATPRMGYGNQPPATFTAFVAWGQVYEAAEGNTAMNTRVHIRDLEAYLLDTNTGRWRLLQFDRLVDGGAYIENFANDAAKAADIRAEAGGTISVTVGDGYNFHFWPTTGRVIIAPKSIGGIFTTVQARLIVDDPTKADDRAQARYLMSVGADYWRDLTARWSADWTANGDVAIGRFRTITNEWQAFNMSSVGLDVLCANPPPLR